MALEKTHKKVVGRPRKVLAKKAKPKKPLAEVEEFLRLAEKYNIDFNYIKE